MKKSLYALLVIFLSVVGANAFAAKIDINVKRVAVETDDQSSNQNGNSGEGGGRNMITREK